APPASSERLRVIAAGGSCGDELADQTIVGEIVLQASLEPLLRLGAEGGRPFGINPRKQPRPPDIGEMSREGIGFAAGLPAVEHHVDPDKTLVRPTVIDE